MPPGRSPSCASRIGLNIDRSRIGRALKAIAASETAAGSVGIDIVKYKVQMFVISAGMASVAGSLGAHYLRAMDPNVSASPTASISLTAVIIGGLTSIWGGALGATVITGLRELLRSLSLPLWESVIMGSLTVVVLIAFPRRARRRHRRRCSIASPGAPAGSERSRSNRTRGARAGIAAAAAAGHRDAGGAGRCPLVRQSARREQGQLQRRGRIDHRADRAERRRQDDVVQSDRRLSAAQRRSVKFARRADRKRCCQTKSRCAASAAHFRTCSCSTT